VAGRTVTATTSSATKRCPFSTRSSAASLLPTPLRPISSSPTPNTSTSTPWIDARGASSSSKRDVSTEITVELINGLRITTTSWRRATSRTIGGTSRPRETMSPHSRRPQYASRPASATASGRLIK
jgi:hypothetical protein